MEQTRAIHLIAVGKRVYHREALAMALHLRTWGMTERIYIHTNEPKWNYAWGLVIPDAVMIYYPDIEEALENEGYGGDYYISRTIKFRIARDHSADLNVFFDTDLAAVKDPAAVWAQIGPNDSMAMTVESYPNLQDLWLRHRAKDGVKHEEWMYMQKEGYINTDAKQWHAGLMLWRKGETAISIFEAWHLEWKRFMHRDQPAFARVMYDNAEFRKAMGDVPKHWMNYIMNRHFFEVNPPKNSENIIFIHSHIGARQFYPEIWKRTGEIIPRFKITR